MGSGSRSRVAARVSANPAPPKRKKILNGHPPYPLLTEVGGHWVVTDDGLSRNGTFLNGDPVAGRRRLQDGGLLEVGDTPLAFRTWSCGESFLCPRMGLRAGPIGR
jgi:hypothetical protein